MTTAARAAAEEALLEAAERLLADVGYAGITTRRLAREAGLNHGLVHYYFGSNESLLVRALERFTARLVARQRALYAADLPFAEKWRTAMRYLMAEDLKYEKIWLELQAMSWNNPEIKAHLAAVNGEWRQTLRDAPEAPRRELPLRHHFEQNFHVRHRLERYGAGLCLDYETAGPGEIAAAIAAEIGRVVDYEPVTTDSAARAARLLAELL